SHSILHSIYAKLSLVPFLRTPSSTIITISMPKTNNFISIRQARTKEFFVSHEGAIFPLR
ncbi:MAG: hypothetical protein AAB048_07040, partial [Planctomycetota bacterium]